MLNLLALISFVGFVLGCGDVDADVKVDKIVVKDNTKEPQNVLETQAKESELEPTYLYPYNHKNLELSNNMRAGEISLYFDRNEYGDVYQVAYQVGSYPENCDDGDVVHESDLKDGVLKDLDHDEIYYLLLCAVSEEGEIAKGIKGKVRTLHEGNAKFSLDVNLLRDGSSGIINIYQVRIQGAGTKEKMAVRFSDYIVEKSTPSKYKESFQLKPVTTCTSPGIAKVEWFEVALVNEMGEYSDWVRHDINFTDTYCYHHE